MDHKLTMSLIWLGYYCAISVWSILGILLLLEMLRKKWQVVKRLCKYLVNSVVFLISYGFYSQYAIFDKSPVEKGYLKTWVNQQIVNDLYVLIIVSILLFGINLFFYKKVDRHKYKTDLFILTIFDFLFLLISALIAGQDGYLGLLEEINRSA